MNSILTIILAVIMAVSPVGGATVNLDEPVSFDVGINLDVEAIKTMVFDTGAEMEEETEQSLKAIGDILNAVTIEGTAAYDTVELSLMTGESKLLSAGVKYSDTGAVVASSLLGSQVFTVTEETIGKMQEEQIDSAAESFSFADFRNLMDAMRNLDREKIKQECVDAGDKLASAIEGKKGETETGEFTVDGLTFTGKTPVNISYTEFMELLLNSFKELVKMDALKPIIEKSGVDTAIRIDEMIDNIRNQPENEQPKFELTIYTDANNNAYYAFDLSDREDAHPISGETAVHLGFGDVMSKKQIRVSLTQDGQKMEMTAFGVIDGKCNMKATITSKDSYGVILANVDGAGGMDMVCSITSKDTSAILTSSSAVRADGRTGFTTNLYIGNPEKALLTVSGSFGKGGMLTSVYEGEDITVTPIEDLINDETGKAMTPIKITLAANAMTSLVALTKNLPTDSAMWVTEQIRKMMVPSTTKTTPTSEPVVDGE